MDKQKKVEQLWKALLSAADDGREVVEVHKSDSKKAKTA
jgi:hypothetical protein